MTKAPYETKARFHSKCPCGAKIVPGQDITIYPDAPRGRKAVCGQCELSASPEKLAGLPPKLTDTGLATLLEKARQAGTVAAKEQLTKLESSGPQWNIVNDKTFGGDGKVVGQMLDVCGFASIHIPNGRAGIVRQLKRVIETKQLVKRAYFHKGYYGGFGLSLFDMTNRQEMSVNEAAEQAALDTLKAAIPELKAHVTTRID